MILHWLVSLLMFKMQIMDRDGDGLSDWLEFGGRTDNYLNIPDNDDWDNRKVLYHGFMICMVKVELVV